MKAFDYNDDFVHIYSNNSSSGITFFDPTGNWFCGWFENRKIDPKVLCEEVDREYQSVKRLIEKIGE